MQQFALVMFIGEVTVSLIVDAETYESAENEFRKLFSSLRVRSIQFDPNEIERI